MTLHKVFFVPLISFKFSKHSKYFFPDIKKCDNRPLGWTTSVNSTYPSIKDSDSIVPLEVKNNLIKDLYEEMVQVFKEEKMCYNFTIKDFWYNIYHDDQGQEPHTHLGGCKSPVWCGIYYNKGTTPTTFIRPDVNNKMHEFAHQSEFFTNYFAELMSPNVSDGVVLLFPPYLKHYVQPSTSDSMRMTFSFNLDINE